jgi:hypothetical protein
VFFAFLPHQENLQNVYLLFKKFSTLRLSLALTLSYSPRRREAVKRRNISAINESAGDLDITGAQNLNLTF